MSKNIVSGAVALLMVLSPVVVSAQAIPQLPANPSIEQLQALIIQLTGILQQLLARRTNPGTDTRPSVTLNSPQSVYSIGDIVNITASVRNAPEASTLCTVLMKEDADYTYSFPPSGGCKGLYSGTNAVSIFGTIISNAGYDIQPGTYHLITRIVGPADGSGKDGASLAVVHSKSFQIVEAKESASLASCSITSEKMSVKAGEKFRLTWTTANMQNVVMYQHVRGGGAVEVPPSGAMDWTAESGGGSDTFLLSQGGLNAPFNPICAVEVQLSGVAPTTNAALSISTDASSPAYQIVAAGSLGVTIGTYKFRASGENQTLQSIVLQHVSGALVDVQMVRLYSGTQQIGTAVFIPGGVSNKATALLTQPVTLQKEIDTVIVAKADLANIGVGQPGNAGNLNKINAISGSSVGINSGTTINSTGSSDVAGWRMYKSYPTFSPIPLPSIGLADGKLLRFSVTANSAGNVQLNQFAISLAGVVSGSVADLCFYEYTDAGFSIPASAGQASGSAACTSVTGNGRAVAGFYESGTRGVIPAGQTRYFELRDTGSRGGNDGVLNSSAITTTLLGDSQQQPLMRLSAAQTSGSNVLFAEESYNDVASVIWSNGYMLPGLPASGFSQTRTGSPATALPQTAGNPITLACPTNLLSANTCTRAHLIEASTANGLNATLYSWIKPGLVYAINFGDGSEVQLPVCNTPTSAAGSCTNRGFIAHVYAQPGTYTVGVYDYTCAVGSTTCNRTIDSIQVTVQSNTPVVCPIYQLPVCPAGQHLLTATSTWNANNCEVPNRSCVADASTPVPTITITAPTITAGATMAVSWSNVAAPTPGDWLAFVPINQAYTQANWPGATVAPWVYASGNANGTAAVKMPPTAGLYQAVYYRNNGFTEVARSGSVSVTPATPTPTPSTGSCTFTKKGSKLAPPTSEAGTSVTIAIAGGQSACSSWCSSQAIESYVYYTCAYNGSPIASAQGVSNVSNISFLETGNMGSVAGVSVSLDQNPGFVFTTNQTANILAAIQDLLNALIGGRQM